MNKPQMLRDIAHHHALARPLPVAFRAPHGFEYHVIGHGLEPAQLTATITLRS